MKLFLSHANDDLYLAQTLKIALKELPGEIDCFLFADEVIPGDDWEERIQAATKECDAIVSLVSEKYASRPWFIAEWTAFWMQGKVWYPLLYRVGPEVLFGPMRRRQAFSLTDRRQTEKFLASLAVAPSQERPLHLVADELIGKLDEADAEHARQTVDARLDQLADSLNGEGSKIDPSAVQAVCDADRLSDLLALVGKSENSVALRKLGAVFIQIGELDAARTVADRTPNRAERRTIGLRALDALKADRRNSALEELCAHIYSSLRDPQRRDLRDAATEREIDLSWPTVDPRP